MSTASAAAGQGAASPAPDAGNPPEKQYSIKVTLPHKREYVAIFIALRIFELVRSW